MSAKADFTHVPVMLDTVLDMLRPELGGPYWDLTLGAGGHLRAFLDRAPDDTPAIGFDGDPDALIRAADLPATLIHGDLGDLRALSRDWPRPRAVLLDVGLSSPQIEDPTRGFSFRTDGPLDMRMDPTRGVPASRWLERQSQKELERVLRELGEERFAGRIARVIKESLPLETTTQLADAVLRALGGTPRAKQHPARRTFQAIRIAVNDELSRFEAGLSAALDALQPGGRLVTLCYHSGEDRIAKTVFRARKRTDLTLLTRRPLQCAREEATSNPRARSVKLRAVEKRAP